MTDSQGEDEGINVEVIEKTLSFIKTISPQPDFAVMPGDLIAGSENYTEMKKELLHFKETITKYYPINFYYPGFGNHEAYAESKGEQAFEEVFSEFQANFLKEYHKTVYYFDKNNSRFYMLNSNHPEESEMISDTQLNWLTAKKDPKKKHNFYFFHEPAYPTGSHVGSSLDTNLLQRDKLWDNLDDTVNPMVFCGHEHNYTRRHINSDFNETIDGQAFEFDKVVYQIVAGTIGGSPEEVYTDEKNVDIPPIDEYSFAIVDVDGSKVKVTVYNLEEEIIDQFEDK